MKRIICGAIALLSFPLIFTSPARSQSSEAELRELYQLCSQFPFNSRCEGYEIPIPLDNRSGARTNCSLEVNNPAETERCKIVISDGQLIAYVEVGEPIAPLDNQRGTEEISIPLSDIFAFEMRIWARRVDAGVVLIGGSLYSQQDEDYAGLERVYDPATDANELAAPANDRDFTEIAISYIVSSNAESDNRSNVLKIVSSEEFGFYLKEQITPTPPASGILVASQAPDTASSAPSGDLIQQLLDTKICVRCDLSNADLSDSDLENANLEGANLQGANLSEANLEGSYLVGANLANATLTQANLSKTWLALASLPTANLEEADLHAASLYGTNFQGSNLKNAKISGTSMEQANFQEARLEGADLSDITTVRTFIPFLGIQRYKFFTSLRGSNFRNANLQNANLEDARIDNADLTGANLTEADLSDVDLSNAILCNTTLPDGSLSQQGCP